MQIRIKEPQRYRAVLIDEQDNREHFLAALLQDRGIVVVQRFGSLGEAVNLHHLPDCDLVVVCLTEIARADCLRLQDGVKAFARPVLAITEDDDPDRVAALVAAGADHVLCIGTSTDRLRSAVAQAFASFGRMEGYRADVLRAEQRLEERKLIERAKGILIQQRAISEPDAMRELQHTSMKRNEPLAQVARTIIAAKELLG